MDGRRQIEVYLKKYLGFLGLQGKLLVFLGFIGVMLVALLLFNLYSLLLVANFSKEISERDIALADAIQNSLLLIIETNTALGQALAVRDPADIIFFVEQKDNVLDLIISIESLLAALTWGSETESFKNANGGIHYNVWHERQFSERFVIFPPSSEQVQLAGVASVYFGGFANHARKTLEAHESYIKLIQNDTDSSLFSSAQSNVGTQYVLTLRFSKLTTEKFLSIVEGANSAISQKAADILNTQRLAIVNTSIISIIGFIIILSVGYIFTAKNIIAPIESLTAAATQISKGDFSLRVPVESEDEIGALANAFNAMTESIGKQTSDIVERLQHLVKEQDTSAKLLIRRDLDLRKANEILKKLDRQKSDFLSVAAHQLRTPLSASKWALRMVTDGDLGPLTIDQKTVLMKGYESNERMIKLVNELLDVDRIASGRYQYVFAPMSIIDQIDSVHIDLLPAINKRNIKIVFNKDEEVSNVLADSKKLRNVIQNLIDNAVKYTPHNGTVTISIVPEGGNMLAVSIEDTGIGIPEDQQGQIFQKFFRGTNARKLKTEGSGLGMYIAKEIVEMHKGRLWLKSEENKGSTFTFTLPTVRDENV